VTTTEAGLEDVGDELTTPTCVAEAVTPVDETWVKTSTTAAESVPTASKVLDDAEVEEPATESVVFLISAPTSLRRQLPDEQTRTSYTHLASMMNWATSAQMRNTTAVSLKRFSATHWVVGERIVDVQVSSITSTIDKISFPPRSLRPSSPQCPEHLKCQGGQSGNM
jgi:hypothetical protein